MKSLFVRRGALLVALSLLSISGPALAHHPAAAGNASGAGPIQTLSPDPMEKGDLALGFTVDLADFDALADDVLAETAESGAASGDPDAHVHSLDTITTASLSLSYGITRSVTLSARLPYIARENLREGHAHEESPGVFHGEAHGLGDAEGWGDLSVMAQWRFFNDDASHTRMALFAGVKAPTGESDIRNSEGERFDAEFQPGSNSWDYLFGLAAARSAGAWRFDASALYTLAGDGLGANLGDRFNYGLAASWRAFGVPVHHHEHGVSHTHGVGLDLVLEIAGEGHGRQSEHGEQDPNSGGHVLFASPGLRYTNNRLSVFASVGAPIVSNFNGLQAEPETRSSFGASYRF